ncbi:MAG: tRNA (adenosine(37)-N6)-threonylcarbamoyltransferase complex dimerization subunit type 1 TsaB [Thermogutta sp.]
MKLLAIETTIPAGSLAFLDDGNVVSYWPLPTDRRSAATLAPEIKRALEVIAWAPSNIQLVAVSIGPGSFTGVRIGLVTAKLFAYAVGAQLIGVNSLDVVAENIPEAYSPLVVVADAQRGEITAKAFTWDAAAGWQTMLELPLTRPEECLSKFSFNQPVWLAGPGVPRHQQILRQRARLVPEALWHPTAAAVAKLAWKKFLQGQIDDIWTLKPIYYRPSYAEEKRLSG